MPNFVFNWQNLNESRAYPIHEDCPKSFPDDVLSDMQVFVPAPRGLSGVYESFEPLFETSLDIQMPYVSRLVVTKYMVTLVVECRGDTLFCTKSLDDIVPYEPVEFVSGSGICTGWVAFGDFDRDSPFDFRADGDSVYLDPRAVVLYPISTIGGFGVAPVDEPVSGSVKLLGSGGITTRVDEKTNTLYLSLDGNPGNMYSDPCYVAQATKSTPDVCSINGAESADGRIIIAFTDRKLDPSKAEDLAVLDSLYQTSSGGSGPQETMNITAYRFPYIGTPGGGGNRVFMDLVGVRLLAASGVSILGYRLVYVPADSGKFNLLQRQLEMHACSGYHRPEYDMWTREKFLPPVAELYRAIYVLSSPESTDSPYFDDDLALKYGAPEEYGATDPTESDGSICNAAAPGVSSWSDANVPIPDPYQKDFKLSLESGGEFRFAHRVWNFGAAGLSDSAYVEVMYMVGSDTSIRTIRQDVHFKTIRKVADPVDPDDFDRGLPVDYLSSKSYIESGEVHGYERKYIHSNRYSESEVIEPEGE